MAKFQTNKFTNQVTVQINKVYFWRSDQVFNVRNHLFIICYGTFMIIARSNVVVITKLWSCRWKKITFSTQYFDVTERKYFVV